MELVTKRVKLKEILPEKKANEFAKRFKIKADELEYVQKAQAPIDMEIKEGERAVIKYVSTISVDRDGDIVLPKGVVLDDFKKNPVVLYAHNYGGAWLGGVGQLPIGKDMWIKADDRGVLAKQVYANHQMADDIYNMHKDGFPLASSIGFIPLETVKRSNSKEWKDAVDLVKSEYGLSDDDFGSADKIFTKVYLLEHSDVPVPSNPDALALAVGKGEFSFTSLDLQNDVLGKAEDEEFEVVWTVEKRQEFEDKFAELQKKYDDLAKQVKEHDDFLFKQPEQKYVTKEQANKKFEGIAQEIKDEINRKLGKV